MWDTLIAYVAVYKSILSNTIAFHNTPYQSVNINSIYGIGTAKKIKNSDYGIYGTVRFFII